MIRYNSVTDKYEDDGKDLPEMNMINIPAGRLANPDGSKDINFPVYADMLKRERLNSKQLDLDMQSNPEKYPMLDLVNFQKPLEDSIEPSRELASQTEAEMNPVVKKYLLEKKQQRDLSSEPQAPIVQAEKPVVRNPFSDDERNKVKAEMESKQSDLAFAQLASSFGDALARKDSSGTQNYFNTLRSNIKDDTLNDFDKRKKQNREDVVNKRQDDLYDPNSNQSQSFRKIIEANFPNIAKAYGDNWQSVSAADKENIFEPLKLKENIEARKEQMRILAQSRQDALDLKKSEKQTKQKQSVTEIQDRYNNIKDSISSLREMVDKYGTQEMIGPQNKEMDQYITSIATDMAKLVDPQSVARESEVASFKKMLFEPGFFQRESSAQGVLNNFEKMVDKRLENAYAVRGIEKPSKSVISKEDDEAIQWAKSNPDDPRAKQILKMHGM